MPTLEQLVAAHARARGEDLAYVGGDHRMTWREYDARADGVAAALIDASVAPGDRVAVCLPDGPAVHACFLGIERARAVVVGIGPRAGRREVEHLLHLTGASLLLQARDADAPSDAVASIPVSEADLPAGRGGPPQRGGDPDALWLLNSTSGTTGLPKCVMHHQRRWFAFHQLAVDAGALTSRDVFLSALPAPFGFGLWTAHVTPTVLGVPCIVLPRFDADACLAAIEREHVSVLAAVSTQFIMLLNAPTLDRYDLTSLRVLFTGGEMVPERRAAEFEDRTGCRVLQFYGSNETGALSRTTVRDTRERRLRTSGAVIPSMHVRLLAEDGADVTAAGGPGVAACRGPLCCLGYYGDRAANDALYTPDGWMLTGDRCTIDADGYLTVAGRASDFIIRGGKNISAAQVEDEVSTHPAVAVAAAVAMPDPVFGERVCAYVELRPRAAPLDLVALQDHLQARGVGKELWPERLVVLDALPRASGGKVAKGALRDDVRRRAEERGRR
ncbi:MAG TPA: class I adenylate-forming enzyme family protein [Acidimicrobiia bacterium]|nr:class I adenylate-forming enzyme family protein [Acidimicrobiia bacterium]